MSSDTAEATYDLFVPGRLCVLGEHTDWAAEYRKENSSIAAGMTIVCATNEGLFARCSHYDIFEASASLRLKYTTHNSDLDLNVPLDQKGLIELAMSGSFFSYIAGTAAVLLQKFSVAIQARGRGIAIDNYQTTLPMKKGLSSSAAVCVLIVKCFEAVYDINLTIEERMKIAYQGEMYTAKCGQMDQCVAMGPSCIALMNFNCGECKLRVLHNQAPLYFVVADLKASPSKNTIRILHDLQTCFPFPSDKIHEGMHNYALYNQSIVWKAVQAIETGSVIDLANALVDAQQSFDKSAIQVCPSELTAPKLRKVMNSPELQSVSLAIKGVGSQGDGSVQVLCSDERNQKQALVILRDMLECDPFMLTVPSSDNAPAPLPLLHTFRVKSAIVIIDDPDLYFPGREHSIVNTLSKELVASGVQAVAVVVPMISNAAMSKAIAGDEISEWNHNESISDDIRNKIRFFFETSDDQGAYNTIRLATMSLQSVHGDIEPEQGYMLLVRSQAALTQTCFSVEQSGGSSATAKNINDFLLSLSTFKSDSIVLGIPCGKPPQKFSIVIDENPDSSKYFTESEGKTSSIGWGIVALPAKCIYA